jgi:hypothetical protein
VAVKTFFRKPEIALIGQENLAFRRMRDLPVVGQISQVVRRGFSGRRDKPH